MMTRLSHIVYSFETILQLFFFHEEHLCVESSYSLFSQIFDNFMIDTSGVRNTSAKLGLRSCGMPAHKIGIQVTQNMPLHLFRLVWKARVEKSTPLLPHLTSDNTSR